MHAHEIMNQDLYILAGEHLDHSTSSCPHHHVCSPVLVKYVCVSSHLSRNLNRNMRKLSLILLASLSLLRNGQKDYSGFDHVMLVTKHTHEEYDWCCMGAY